MTERNGKKGLDLRKPAFMRGKKTPFSVYRSESVKEETKEDNDL